jgi:hypothetical protein
MLKKSLFHGVVAILLMQTIGAAEAMPGASGETYSCLGSGAEQTRSCARQSGAALLLVRDTRAAASGGGRGASSCWSACFNDYNACVDAGPKQVCVSRMKTCLAICDSLSNRPGM